MTLPAVALELFAKIDLRVARIVEAEQTTNGAFTVTVDLGHGEHRAAVLALDGSAASELLDKIVIYRAGKNVDLGSILSTGSALVTVDRAVPLGTRFR